MFTYTCVKKSASAARRQLHSSVSGWYTEPWPAVLQKSFSGVCSYLGRMSMCQCTSITFKAPTQFPTARQQGHFDMGRMGALIAAAPETSPSSALHSGVDVRETMWEIERHELFRTKKKNYTH